jgi:hypothetical protein
MRPVSLIPAVVLVAALAAAGCDEKLADVAGPSPNLTPTFSSISKEIFEASDSSGRAACTNCHTTVGRTPAGGLNLLSGAAYGALVNVNSTQKPTLKRVDPGNPDGSYLVHKLEGAPGIVGLRMPRNGPPFLTSGQMRVIRRWIELGAKND